MAMSPAVRAACAAPPQLRATRKAESLNFMGTPVKGVPAPYGVLVKPP